MLPNYWCIKKKKKFWQRKIVEWQWPSNAKVMDIYFTYEAWEEQSTEERIVNRPLYATQLLVYLKKKKNDKEKLWNDNNRLTYEAWEEQV